MSFLAQHQWSLVIFLGVLAMISLSNLLAFRRLPSPRPSGRQRRVSALVPARNEERNIARCVGSLLAQDATLLEVIVLDDASEDATWHETERFVQDPRFRRLRGAPLPGGWLGKTWACHQLSEEARGEILLFLDADVVLRPRAAAAIAEALGERGHAALSVLPRERTGGLGEGLVLPILPWSLHTFIPFALLHALPFRRGSLTSVGQVMAFRREAYQAIGGHAAVRGEVAEDREIARKVAQEHLTFDLVDGSSWAESRPYVGWGEVGDGFSKSLFATFGRRLLPYLFVWTWLAWVATEPPVVLALALARHVTPGLALPAGIAIGIELLLWAIVCARFRTPAWQTLAYPATAVALLGIAARSALWDALGHGHWKGRRLRPS